MRDDTVDPPEITSISFDDKKIIGLFVMFY